MCTHFRSYLRGTQFMLRTDHRSLRWLQKFQNSDGMLARWYICMLFGQFSLTFAYQPGAQHANADGLSRQCGHCLRPDCPVSSPEGGTGDSGATSALLDQSFASSAMGDLMDADLLTELSGETWVAATYLDKVTADLPPAVSEQDLIAASRLDKTLTTVREWVQSGLAPSWSDCAGLSPELRSWQLQFGNLSIDSEGRLWRRRAPPSTTSQLVVPLSERRGLIQRYHDSIFAGHLGVSQTVFRLLDRVYWPRSMLNCIWLAVRSDLPENLPALGGRQCVAFRLVTVGTGWPWTFWI